jgi:hypothetical protein
MNPEIKNYISKQPSERQEVMIKIHSTIVAGDNSIEAIVEPMMGNEMIIYKRKGLMKYGLASMKNYMSLHLLPMYGSKPLYEKYRNLLHKAKFQKGCINFNKADEMPLDIVEKLITDCSKIDLAKMRENYLKLKAKVQ